MKKIALTSLRSAGDLRLKENDRIIQDIEATNKSEVLFFTNKGEVYKLHAYEIQDAKPSELGEYTPNLLELEDDERVIAIHVTTEEYEGYLILGFADGRCVKITVDNYYTKTNRRKLRNGFYNGSPLIGILYQTEENSGKDIIMQNDQDRMILLESDRIGLKATRNSQGNKIMSLRGNHQADYLGYAEQFSDKYELDYYRVRTLPAAGRFIKEEDMSAKQMSLTELSDE